MPLYYAQQYITKTLNGAIDASQTSGITLSNTTGLDIAVPGIVAISWSDPLNTTNVEWISYTSINGSGVLQGVTRGVEGSTGKSHSNGAVIAFPISKAHINELNDGLKDVLSVTPNYKIVPSVASDNLTVALKTLAGNDPSTSDPIYIRIGDEVRTITSALSVTANAGTNWFNSGSSELATKEVDYFVYLGYNSTDGVVIGFSRIPYATKYSEFNTTTTNEKYAKISTITNASSDDYYSVIGRFGATLSAGAGYTWTIPTFSATNLINRPIYETRWLDYTGVVSMGNSGTYTSITYSHRRYKISDSTMQVRLTSSGTLGGSATNNALVTIPMSPINISTALDSMGSAMVNTTAGTKVAGVIYQTSTSFNIRQEASANYPTSGTGTFSVNCLYEI